MWGEVGKKVCVSACVDTRFKNIFVAETCKNSKLSPKANSLCPLIGGVQWRAGFMPDFAILTGEYPTVVGACALTEQLWLVSGRRADLRSAQGASSREKKKREKVQFLTARELKKTEKNKEEVDEEKEKGLRRKDEMEISFLTLFKVCFSEFYSVCLYQTFR